MVLATINIYYNVTAALPYVDSHLSFIDWRQCLTLAKIVYTSCHVPLTAPFVIYHSFSILRTSYHSLLFQMNGIKHHYKKKAYYRPKIYDGSKKPSQKILFVMAK